MSRRFMYAAVVLALGVSVFLIVFDSPRAAVRKSGFCTTGMERWLRRQAPWLWAPCRISVAARLAQGGISVVFHPTERAHGLRVARLDKEWQYCDDATGSVVRVPKDFFTDFASIPWYARPLFDPTGDNTEAAVVHDWMYSVGQNDARWNRKAADGLFRAVLKESDVNMIKRNVMFAAVRVGGGRYFKQGDGIAMRGADWKPYSQPRPATAIAETRADCDGFDGLPPRGRHLE